MENIFIGNIKRCRYWNSKINGNSNIQYYSASNAWCPKHIGRFGKNSKYRITPGYIFAGIKSKYKVDTEFNINGNHHRITHIYSGTEYIVDGNKLITEKELDNIYDAKNIDKEPGKVINQDGESYVYLRTGAIEKDQYGWCTTARQIQKYLLDLRGTTKIYHKLAKGEFAGHQGYSKHKLEYLSAIDGKTWHKGSESKFALDGRVCRLIKQPEINDKYLPISHKNAVELSLNKKKIFWKNVRTKCIVPVNTRGNILKSKIYERFEYFILKNEEESMKTDHQDISCASIPADKTAHIKPEGETMFQKYVMKPLLITAPTAVFNWAIGRQVKTLMKPSEVVARWATFLAVVGTIGGGSVYTYLNYDEVMGKVPTINIDWKQDQVEEV